MKTFSQIHLLSLLFEIILDYYREVAKTVKMSLCTIPPSFHVLTSCITVAHLLRLKILTLLNHRLDRFTNFVSRTFLNTFGWCLSISSENYQLICFKILTVLQSTFLLTFFLLFLMSFLCCILFTLFPQFLIFYL